MKKWGFEKLIPSCVAIVEMIKYMLLSGEINHIL